MEKDALIEKLLKIKKLSERGVGGERANATRIVEKLMEKHGITEEELRLDDVRSRVWFRYPAKNEWARRLLNQIVYCVTGDGSVWTRGRRAMYGAECTRAEAVEIEAMYEFYKEVLERDMQTFYSAFLHKNNLFPPKTVDKDNCDEEEDAEKTDEEEITRIRAMMRVMEKHDYHKQLEEEGTYLAE